MLTNLWVQPSNYIFPLTKKNEKRGLRFQYKWFMEFQWLSYSDKNHGAFCKYCVLFAKVGEKNGQPLGYFVKTAFDTWKKAKQVIYCFYLPIVNLLLFFKIPIDRYLSQIQYLLIE